MRVLLTNDDGIDAPGLQTLAAALPPSISTVVMAPDRHLSGCGHQVTTERPLTVDERGPNRLALDGTPADCTRVGLHHFRCAIDWVFSGVNAGGNLGVDTYMSGTVAAVREAALWNVPAIAFSQYRHGPATFDWEFTARLIPIALAWILDQPQQPGTFWNVNFPDPQTTGTALPEVHSCPLDPHPVDVRFAVSGTQYEYRGVYQNRRRLSGSDVDRCFSGSIAITRLAISGHDDPPCPPDSAGEYRPLCDG